MPGSNAELNKIYESNLRAVAWCQALIAGVAISAVIFLSERSKLTAMTVLFIVSSCSVLSLYFTRNADVQIFKARFVLSISVFVILLASTLTNGGYDDPRTVFTLIYTALFLMAIHGPQKAPIILGAFTVYAILLAALEYVGLLNRIQSLLGESPAIVYLVNSTVAAAGVLIGLVLIIRYESAQRMALKAQSESLSEALANAESARRAESRFLSNMSHEIRNPLNGIKGLLSNLTSENDLPEHVREDLDHALTAANHLNNLVDDILELKKIEEGHFSIDEQPYDLHSALISARVYREKQAKDKGIIYISNYELADLPRFVISDYKRWYQIASNIIGNALKFTEKGYVKETLVWADGWLTMIIEDTGIGIPDEMIDKLFRRFEQGNTGIAKRFGGSGLGLALTKQLVEAIGGSITLESEAGRGTTVTIKAPLKRDVERERLQLEEPASSNNESQRVVSDLAGLRVLCVDDSSINLKVISRPLIKAGALVTTALSAREALDYIGTRDFDIVFTDISMPDMDGEQLQRELKSWKVTLPVVAVTGNVLKEDVDRYLANGFVAALAKPLEADRLIDVITEHVKSPISQG